MGATNLLQGRGCRITRVRLLTVFGFTMVMMLMMIMMVLLIRILLIRIFLVSCHGKAFVAWAVGTYSGRVMARTYSASHS